MATVTIERPRTIEDLQDAMLQVFHEVEKEPLSIKFAAVKANMAGKVFAGIRTQMAYHAQRGEFLNSAFMRPRLQASKSRKK